MTQSTLEAGQLHEGSRPSLSLCLRCWVDKPGVPCSAEWACLVQAWASLQYSCSGWPTGYGKKLRSSQAQLGQVTCLAVA